MVEPGSLATLSLVAPVPLSFFCLFSIRCEGTLFPFPLPLPKDCAGRRDTGAPLGWGRFYIRAFYTGLIFFVML